MPIRPRGFTLIELSATMAIIGLIGVFTVPALQSVRYAANGRKAHTELLSTVLTASHKAALHGVHTVICPSADGIHCQSGYDWSLGWIAYIDNNNTREREPEETLIQRQGALTDARLISTSGRTRIVFQGNGGNAGSNVTFTLCDKRGPDKAQTLILSNTGNLRQSSPNAGAIAEACRF